MNLKVFVQFIWSVMVILFKGAPLYCRSCFFLFQCLQWAMLMGLSVCLAWKMDVRCTSSQLDPPSPHFSGHFRVRRG